MRINLADPSTWPNMAPPIRYFFAPQLAALLLIVAVVVNAVAGIGRRRPFAPLWGWVVLGLAYSLPPAAFPLSYLGVGLFAALTLSSLCTFLAVWWGVRCFGGNEPRSGGA